MALLVEISGMAKKKGRPRTGRDDVTIKIDRQLATMAKVIAGRRAITATELLDDIIRTPLNRLYNQLIQEVAAEKDGPE